MDTTVIQPEDKDASFYLDQAALTGQDRMAVNVLANWAGHFVFIVAGFIVPRIMDRRIGQEALGVWDFGWSLVAYFGLVSGGVMSSISRYVARYRAVGQMEKLNSTVSTGLVIYLCSGTIVLALTVATAMFMPKLFAERLGEHVDEARWVILFLGLSLVIQFVFAVFTGVITGCHRWGALNVVRSGVHCLTTAAMIVLLLMGGDLRGLAAVSMLGELLSGLMRGVLAYRCLPGLRLSLQGVGIKDAGELIWFGGKTMLGSIAHMIMYQTTHVLIVGYLGVAVLALYVRPASLVRHVSHLVNKFANVLTPTASALQTHQELPGPGRPGQAGSLQELLVTSARYGLYLSLPMVLILALMGGPILRIWMGDRYDQGTVLAILAVGHLPSLSQQTTYQILMGMNRHGVPAFVRFVSALCSIVLAALALGPLGWGLPGAAWAVVVPLTLANAVIVPVYACRSLGMSYFRYLVRTVPGPVAAGIPLAGSLVLSRTVWPDQPWAMLGWGLGIGGIITGVIYWRYVIPTGVREALGQILRPKGRARSR